MVKHIFKLHDQYLKKDHDKLDTDTKYEKAYIRSIQSQKKKNMDMSMYYIYCLNGIPGVSIILAKRIQELFPTFKDFLKFIQENDETKFIEEYQKHFKKKLNKNVITNIYHFFS
jgi:hypothetical protein